MIGQSRVVRHARSEALDRLEPIMAAARALPAFKERGRGVFYVNGRAALHFHEDATGLYADLRLSGTEFERIRVETASERKAFADLLAERCA